MAFPSSPSSPRLPRRTERLALRPLTEADLDELFTLHSDPRTFELDSTTPLTSREQMAWVLEQWNGQRSPGDPVYSGVHWIAADAPPDGLADAQLIGVAGFTPRGIGPHRVLSAYYRFRPEAWGHGIALEAMSDQLRDLERTHPGELAVIVTDDDNTPSRRLAERLGFDLDERLSALERQGQRRETDGAEESPDEPGSNLVVLSRRLAGTDPERVAVASGSPRPLGPPGAGRYAPSPSGDLHLGNLRTAVLAWVLARRSGRAFRLRLEDLDRVRPGSAERQVEDLLALGLDWDGPVLRQSDRVPAYEAAVDELAAADLVYECYCTRREIQGAPSAPHGAPGAYPGTCRDLSPAERAAGRERMRALDREPALRLRAGTDTWSVHDVFAGQVAGTVDDLVLRRGDGVYAYNLAAVLDDAETGVDQVTRGDDLLSSAPRQAYLAHLLGHAAPEYAHVPLAVSPRGARLAKRDGAVTLRDRRALGESAADVMERIGDSLGVPGCRRASDLLERWDPASLPREPWVVDLPAAG